MPLLDRLGGLRRVVVTTCVRGALIEEVSARLHVLDLAEDGVSFVTPVPESIWRAEDPNPRGGVRGAKGVSVHGDRLVLGNAEHLFLFDTSWRLVARFSHNLLGGLHDILAEEEGIWVTCVRSDSVALIGWDGQLVDWWSPRIDRNLRKRLELGRTPGVDLEIDYRDPRAGDAARSSVDLNGVTRGGGGLLLCFGRVVCRRRRLWRHVVSPASFAVVELPIDRRPLSTAGASVRLHRRDQLVGAPNHNAVEDGDVLVYNDSNRNCLVVYDTARNAEVRAVPIPGDPPFARGLTRVEPGLWLVGSQDPAAVHAVDTDRGAVVATFPLDAIPYETVYAVTPLPEAFDDPPQSASEDPRAFWAVQTA
jgi:hypothetical protein